MKEENRND